MLDDANNFGMKPALKITVHIYIEGKPKYSRV